MKTKHLVAAGVASIALGGVAILPFAVVSADEVSSTTATTFVQKLAEKLGINVETVQTAVESTRTEIRDAREAERETAIADAVTAGTLTQRQADIFNAIDEAMQTIRGSMTQEQREAEREANQGLTMEERKNKMETELVTALNNAGLNTTADELTATRDAARDADIMPAGKGGRGGFGGPGMGL